MSEELYLQKTAIIQMLRRKKTEHIIPTITTTALTLYGKEANLIMMYTFFAHLYEDIYHDLLTKKIKIEKKVLRILEYLASPIYKNPSRENMYALHQIFRLKEKKSLLR